MNKSWFVLWKSKGELSMKINRTTRNSNEKADINKYILKVNRNVL